MLSQQTTDRAGPLLPHLPWTLPSFVVSEFHLLLGCSFPLGAESGVFEFFLPFGLDAVLECWREGPVRHYDPVSVMCPGLWAPQLTGTDLS